MRRFLGPVLVGLGLFLVVAAVLLRFYAEPRLAVAPIDQNSVTRLEAVNAEVFDTSTLEPLRTGLTAQSRTVGDVEASKEKGDNVRVWVNTTSITSTDGVVRSRSTERTAFDATTAEAVNCCGAFYETTQGEREEVKREGLVFKFPFGTEKKDYQGETEIQGLTVYKFVSEVPRTQVGEREVPAAVLGEDGTDPITAESMYQATKTYFVEPVTGAIVDQEIDQKSTLALDGEDRVTTTEAVLQYTQPTVDANVDDFSQKSSLLRLVGTTLPIVFFVLGLIALVGGVLLGRRRRVEERY